MGTKDLPAFIDFILETTGLESISYVGHSEGTNQFFLGASLMPEYFTEKINLSIMLAPVGSTANMEVESFRNAAPHFDSIEKTLLALKMYNLVPPKDVKAAAYNLICNIPLVKPVCTEYESLLNDPDMINVDRMDMARSIFPSG